MVKEREDQQDVQSELDQAQRRKPWQRYLEASLGLRNYWYPALFSRELPEDHMRAEIIAGERLFFKRIDGKVYCVEDRCIHRGVPFSPRPECYTDNTLTCWFHGFTYDWRTGKLVQILTEEDSALLGKVGIKAYPTQEVGETIFVYIGDGAPHDIREDAQPRLFDADLVVEPLVRYKIKCNWRVAAENGFDAAHIYGHRDWVGFRRGGLTAYPLGTYPSSKDIVRVLEEDGKPKGVLKRDDTQVYAAEIDGVDIRVEGYPKDAPRVRHEPRETEVSCFMPAGLQVVGFPKRGMVHFEWYVPIDDDHHMYTILQGGYAKTPEEREAFKRECREVLGPLVWNEPGKEPAGFNNFDSFGRKWTHHAYAKEDWWHRERLFKPDYIIMQWRMLVAKHARAIQTWGNWQKPDEDDIPQVP